MSAAWFFCCPLDEFLITNILQGFQGKRLVGALLSCSLSVHPKSDPAYSYSCHYTLFHTNILPDSHPAKARFAEWHYKVMTSCPDLEVIETRFVSSPADVHLV